MISALEKYNVAVPRYTSYPTVPQWENNLFSKERWIEIIRETARSGKKQAIGVYIHLPYCESLCTYCGCNTRITVNHAVESPYIDAILREWEMYIALFDSPVYIKELHLGGGTPTFFSPENLQILIRGIFSKAEVLPGADLSFEGHPNNTTYNHLEVLHKLGFNRVSFGVQDLSPVVQEAINRIQPYENVKQVIDWARQLKYLSVNVDLVYGLPFQTLQALQSTVKNILALRPDRIAYYSYAHVPWKKPGQRKFTEKDLPSAAEKSGMFDWAVKEFEKEGYLSIGLDHFSLPGDALAKAMGAGTLHRNFMGYTPNQVNLLIGLGCSAISDVGWAFAQNPLTVEEYISTIQTGELAVRKGHFLTETDFIIRQKITEIMCTGQTSWSGLSKPTINHIQSVLSPCVEDGLVHVNNEGIQVTLAGNRFVRNICLCFDLRHQQQNSSAPQYSNGI